ERAQPRLGIHERSLLGPDAAAGRGSRVRCERAAVDDACGRDPGPGAPRDADPHIDPAGRRVLLQDRGRGKEFVAEVRGAAVVPEWHRAPRRGFWAVARPTPPLSPTRAAA